MKAALAHHLVAPVEPPANQHESNGERRDAEDHKQRHEVTTTAQVAAGILNSTGIRRSIVSIETHHAVTLVVEARQAAPGAWRGWFNAPCLRPV